MIDDSERRDWEASIYRMTDAEDAMNNNYQEQLRQHEAGLADHSQRIAALENLIRSTPESESIRTTPPPEFVPYVSIPSSQWQEVTQEIIDVRDKWDSIPWNEITLATWKLEAWPDSSVEQEAAKILKAWIVANVEQMHAPEEHNNE